MADDKLSGKAGLDTTQFKTGIAEMNRELRVLESGFRASAAGLGDWSKDATGLENRIKSLNAQMDIQRQKVAATRAEYERIKAEKGENSRAAQDLEIKLNKETETLGKMESELRTTESSLEEMRTGTDEAGQSVEELGNTTDDTGESFINFQSILDDTQQVAKTAITVVAGLAAGVLAVAAAIGGMVFAAVNAGGELQDMSDKTGISTQRLQELQFIGNQVGTSLDTITGANARLIRSMFSAKGGSKEQAEAFSALGVSVTDANGDLRDSQTVFDETLDALGKMTNPAEADALAMKIFGKSAQELNPLIKLGSKGMAEMTDQAHELGAVMSEEDVSALDAFGDTITGLKDGLKGTLGTLAGEFLPVAQLVADSIKELFNSDEFKQGIKEFSEILQGVVQTTVSVLKDLLSGNTQGALTTLFGADNATALLNFFQQVRSFIFDTLIPFVTTHAEEIKAALVGIGAALAAAAIVGIITSIVAAITALASPLGLIIATVGFLAAAWKGNWFGIRDTVTDIWENFLQPVLQELWDWLADNIPDALKTLSNFWTGTLLPAVRTVWSWLSGTLFPFLGALGNLIGVILVGNVKLLVGIWMDVFWPAIQKIWKFLDENLFPIFIRMDEFLANRFRQSFEAISHAIETLTGWLSTLADWFANLTPPDWLTDWLGSFGSSSTTPTFPAPDSPTHKNVSTGITQVLDQLNQQLPKLAANLSGVTAGNTPATVLPNGGSATQTDVFQFFAPVTIQGDTTSDSLAAKLRGRRY